MSVHNQICRKILGIIFILAEFKLSFFLITKQETPLRFAGDEQWVQYGEDEGSR